MDVRDFFKGNALERYEKINKSQPKDYAPLSNRCFACGATFSEPRSGCPICHRSFVS